MEPTCNIVLAHPKYVKAIREKKTDKKDTKWIADIFNHANNCLIVSNIKLDNVFSDVFGKAATAITPRLLENHTQKDY